MTSSNEDFSKTLKLGAPTHRSGVEILVDPCSLATTVACGNRSAASAFSPFHGVPTLSQLAACGGSEVRGEGACWAKAAPIGSFVPFTIVPGCSTGKTMQAKSNAGRTKEGSPSWIGHLYRRNWARLHQLARGVRMTSGYPSTETSTQLPRPQEANRIPRAFVRFIRFLPGVIGTSKVGLDPQVSLALTPTGPLVYQWLG